MIATNDEIGWPTDFSDSGFLHGNDGSGGQKLSVTVDSDNRIRLRIGSEFQTGETHYLAMDANGSDRRAEILPAVQTLLHRWIGILAASCDTDLLYLPFDFSDEVTQWMACHRTSRSVRKSVHRQSYVTIVFGRMAIEGWEASPETFDPQMADPSAFIVNEPANPQTFYLPWLLSQLRRASSALRDSAGV